MGRRREARVVDGYKLSSKHTVYMLWTEATHVACLGFELPASFPPPPIPFLY